jgi:hypothetical protein
MILCVAGEPTAEQEERDSPLRMQQIIRRSVIIGQHWDVVVGQRPVEISDSDVLDWIGEKALVYGHCPFHDLFDIEPLFVAGRDDYHVLDRVHTDVVGAPRRENVSLGKNLPLSFDE